MPKPGTEEQKQRARERARAWHAANRERANAKSRQHNELRKEERSAYRAEFYAKNKDVIKARNREYVAKNAEKVAAYHAAYRAKNKERIAAYRAANKVRRLEVQNNRRSRGVGVLTKGIAERLLRLQQGRCANCRCRLKKTGWHLDHVMPLALGGTNTDDNVQILCPTCNVRKRAKHPIEWAQQQGRLL